MKLFQAGKGAPLGSWRRFLSFAVAWLIGVAVTSLLFLPDDFNWVAFSIAGLLGAGIVNLIAAIVRRSLRENDQQP